MTVSNLHHVLRIVSELPEAKAEGNQHYQLTIRRKTLERRPRRRRSRPVLPAAYLASRGYVGLYLDTEYVGWDEVRELLTDAYRLAAPKKLVALLPDEGPRSTGDG